MHQEVQLRIRELLKKQGLELNTADVARVLGIHDVTAKHYLEDRWTSIDRAVLEKFADLLTCNIEDLFLTRRSPFWDTFPNSRVHCLHPPGEKTAGNVSRDAEALKSVAKLVGQCAPDAEVHNSSAGTLEEFKHLLNDNCVVIGSPRSNPATNWALSEIFGTDEAPPAEAVPFRFRWQPHMGAEENQFNELSNDVGILLRHSNHMVKADFTPDLEKFKLLSTKTGRDCGVIAVMNRRVPSGMRKLIVLAGSTQIGTEAAAKRLVADFRECEPRNGESLVWGIVDVVFEKLAGNFHRNILRSDWRYRVGGRLPIVFKKRPIQVRGGARKWK